MLPDGSQKVKITTLSGNDYIPVLSPDGQNLLFTQYSIREGNLEIYVLDLITGEEKNLTNNSADDVMASWSPDGEKIVFVSMRDLYSAIYTMNADGTSPIRLTEEQISVGMPVWSPDGETIAFVSKRSGLFTLYTMSVDGTDQTRLTDDSLGQLTPAWSPAGDKLAFAQRTTRGDFDLFVMDITSQTITQLTQNPGDDLAPAWSPDGNQIVFMSKVNEFFALFLVNPDGSGVVPLTNEAGSNNGSPNWQSIPLAVWNHLQTQTASTVTPYVDVTYVVQEGDSASTIAERYGIAAAVILATNQIEVLQVGQTIIIPGVAITDPATGERVHFVREGETAFGIARTYNISVDVLLAHNNLANPTLFVGQRIIIPD
jgi:Tol biopolymer transport system component/LysM repeat protein